MYCMFCVHCDWCRVHLCVCIIFVCTCVFGLCTVQWLIIDTLYLYVRVSVRTRHGSTVVAVYLDKLPSTHVPGHMELHLPLTRIS